MLRGLQCVPLRAAVEKRVLRVRKGLRTFAQNSSQAAVPDLTSGRQLDLWASLVAQTVKTLPAVQGAWVRSLGWEDPLEKGMATPVLLPGESHGQRSLAGRSSSSRRVRHNRATHTGPMSVFTFQMRTESEALGGPTQA